MEIEGKLVSVKTANKIDLPGFLVPNKKNKTNKIFVMSHGRGGSFYSGYGSFLPFIINAVHACGFDFLGVSDSGSGFFRLYDRFETCVDDYSSWLNFCKVKGYDQIILGSHSYGPIKIAYFFDQIKPKEVKGLFFLAQTDTYGIWKNYVRENANKFLGLAQEMINAKNSKDLMPKEAYYNPISAQSYFSLYGKDSKIHVFDFQDKNFNFEVLKNISVPVLTIVGKEDKNPLDAQPEVKEKILNKVLKNPTTVLIDGADHVFTNKGEELEKELESWLKNF